MDIERRVAGALRELGVRDEDPIGIACSGGADSVALVHLLAQPGRVTVLHVDHQARADSADDAAFVRSMAERLGLRFAVKSVIVAKRTGSFEAAAREARYAALRDLADEHRLPVVLTAHTSDDQAETVLLRLMRGGSLVSIAPVTGIFVRPLLDVTRCDVREWLVRHAIEWREDPTNADVRYERNWVRNVLLPQMHERRPGVAKVLARAATRARSDEHALNVAAADVVASAASDDVGVFVAGFDLLPEAVAARVVRMVCRRLGHDPGEHDLAAVRASIPHARCGPIDLWRLRDGLAFIASPLPVPAPVAVPSSGMLASPEWGIRIRTTAPSGPGLLVRSRLPGDRVRMSAGTRKVQDVLVDAKVPRPFRALVPILADESGAIAVITSGPGSAAPGTVLDVEPYGQTWSRQRAWVGAWTR
jgi:tRNA(Ile)-lysidine synthase